jgi:hypothetical protein
MHSALNAAKIDRTEKVKAFKRLSAFASARVEPRDAPAAVSA